LTPFHGPIVSVFDQAFVSLANFLTGVLVARAVSQEAFGTFTLLYTSLVIVSILSNALIISPMRVVGVKHIDNKSYIYNTVAIQGILAGLFALLAIIIGLVFLPIHIVVLFALSLFLYQLQQLVRSIFQTSIKVNSLLAIDASSNIIRVALLFYFLHADQLSIAIALIALIISSLMTCAGFIWIRGNPEHKPIKLQQTHQENWQYGRWILADVILTVISLQAYLYYAGIWLDMQSVGGLGAMQNLLNTVNVIQIGFMAVAIPMARTKLEKQGYQAWKRWNFALLIILPGSISIILGLLSWYSSAIMGLIYANKFNDFAYLLPFFACAYVLATLNTVLANAFRTAGKPSLGLHGKAGSAGFTLLCAYFLIQHFGVIGAVGGIVLSQTLICVVYVSYIVAGKLSQANIDVAR